MPQFYISDWQNNFFEQLYAFAKEKAENQFQNSILIMPTMRSKKIAIEYFQEFEKNSFLPEIITVPEWLVYLQEVWLDENILKSRKIDELESIALLYDIVTELAHAQNNGGGEEFNLFSRMLNYKENESPVFLKELKSFKHFYSYGQYLNKIIQECYDENSKALSLPYFGEEVNEFSSYLLDNLREITNAYQMRLVNEALSTKEYLKFCLAQKIESDKDELLPLFDDKLLFFCGLDQVSKTEEVCLQYFASKQSYFLFSTDSKLVSDYQNAHWSTTFYKEWANKWNAEFCFIPSFVKNKVNEDNFFFHQAFDTHSQFQNIEISNKSLDSKSIACVLNSEQSLMPLIYNLNKEFSDNELNATMGYPLKETKLYNFIYLLDLIKNNARKYEVKVKVNSEENEKNFTKVKAEEKNKFLNAKNLDNSPNKDSGKKSERFFIKQSELYEFLSFPLFYSSLESSATGEPDYIHGLKASFSRIDAPYICIDEVFIDNEELSAKIANLLEILKAWFSLTSLYSLVDFICSLEKFLEPFLHSNPLERLALRRLVNKAYDWQEKHRIINENIGYELCASLVFDFFSANSVPFEHHSNKALQILGLRETKLLSFDEAHIFDANDDMLPPRPEENPLLPEKLRQAIGLKSIRANEIYTAHTWYRLLASCDIKHIYWQESTVKTLFDDKKIPSPYVEEALWVVEQKKGEILKANNKDFTQAKCMVKIEQKELSITIKDELKKAVHELCSKPFSSTSLDTFLACPLKFFYQNIISLKGSDEVKEEENPRLLGNLVHAFMQKLYPEHSKKITKEELLIRYKAEIIQLDSYLKSEGLLDVLPAESMFLLKTSFPYRMKKYIENQPDVTKVIGIEKEFKAKLNPINGCEQAYNFYGILDRIDERTNNDTKEKEILIIDYKTGLVDKKIAPAKFWENQEFFDDMHQNILSFQEDFAVNQLKSIYKATQSIQMPIYMFLTHENNCNITNALYVDLYDTCKEKMVLDVKGDVKDIIGNRIPILLNFMTNFIENTSQFTKTEHAPCGWCSYNKYCN